MNRLLSNHFLIEIFECNFGDLDNLEFIKDSLIQAAKISNSTIIQDVFHKFSPQGVSGVVVIAESHISIHTWPEHGYAAMDFFTCNKSLDIKDVSKWLRQAFNSEKVFINCIPRGEIQGKGSNLTPKIHPAIV